MTLIRAVISRDRHPCDAALCNVDGRSAVSLRGEDDIAVGEDLELAVHQALTIAASLGCAAAAAQSAAGRSAAFVEAAIRAMRVSSTDQGSDGRCRAEET